ncbi:GDSL-type esterase/lipase family protein [Maribacter sp. TH_r10]|uniref:DUF459 domain-containing protein n=1 Tax=Maribacter sp. TH_r10 TaxID=3082086 RepID=UPI002953B3FD|nr:GDSL-type esterase/lipase family protein [Maribacter sp. TH_r10]MDV7139141.1 GDSL-type esterase/lipase family protein [Maribacter sp. TH_r10]
MKQGLNCLLLILTMLGPKTTNAQVFNAGIGGNNTKNLLERLDADVLRHNPDLVIVMVGTNDMLNSKKMIYYRNYAHNLEEIIQRIKVKGAEVVLMTPPPVDSMYLFQRHDRNAYREIPNVKMDSTRQIIKKLARKDGLGCIDLFQIFSDMGLPEHNVDLFFRNERNSGAKDGVHPTALGYRFIAETVFDYLKMNALLKKGQKLVCFGDSITHGAGTKNRGTVTGQNYPAVLSALIQQHFQK